MASGVRRKPAEAGVGKKGGKKCFGCGLGPKACPCFPPSVPYKWRQWPMEVRRVCQSTRRLVLVDRLDTYHDACLFAAWAVEETGEPHVVWDMQNERVLYDSRKLGAKRQCG